MAKLLDKSVVTEATDLFYLINKSIFSKKYR